MLVNKLGGGGDHLHYTRFSIGESLNQTMVLHSGGNGCHGENCYIRICYYVQFTIPFNSLHYQNKNALSALCCASLVTCGFCCVWKSCILIS